MKKNNASVRKIAVTAVLSAMSSVLMFINFSLPIMPSFIKVDFSELPALIASFTMGPFFGVLVCLVKNLVNLFQTSTMGIGELSNFLLGSIFVFTAGLIYKKIKNRKGALIGSILGAILMAVIGLFTNYFLVYPIYTNFMPMEAIVGMYKAIYPGVKNLFHALVIFNIPFTFLKGMANTLITFTIYKKISPIIKGNKF